MTQLGLKMVDDFVELWRETAENDPYWAFEELLEENTELAEAVWTAMNIEILVRKRLGIL